MAVFSTTVYATNMVWSSASKQSNQSAGTTAEYIGSSYRWLLTFDHGIDLSANRIVSVTTSITTTSEKKFSLAVDIGAYSASAKASQCDHATRAVAAWSPYGDAGQSGYYKHVSPEWSAAALNWLNANGTPFMVWLHSYDSSTQTGGEYANGCTHRNSVQSRRPSLVIRYEDIPPEPVNPHIASVRENGAWVRHPMYARVNGVWKPIVKVVKH